MPETRTAIMEKLLQAIKQAPNDEVRSVAVHTYAEFIHTCEVVENSNFLK